VQIDPDYVPAPQEYKDAFGVTFQQGRNNFEINEALLTNLVTENRDLPEAAKRDMIVALITLKYTQSNSVCYVKDGQAIGVGRRQRIGAHGEGLLPDALRQHVLILVGEIYIDGVIPVRAANVLHEFKYGRVMAFTGMRLFHH